MDFEGFAAFRELVDDYLPICNDLTEFLEKDVTTLAPVPRGDPEVEVWIPVPLLRWTQSDVDQHMCTSCSVAGAQLHITTRYNTCSVAGAQLLNVSEQPCYRAGCNVSVLLILRAYM